MPFTSMCLTTGVDSSVCGVWQPAQAIMQAAANKIFMRADMTLFRSIRFGGFDSHDA
jgi:hypothetical protein